MVAVPQSYQQYVAQAASGTGLPQSVVASQAVQESGFNANARSSAGALGWLQFMPSTYNGLAAQAGVPPNTETNVADETKVYIVYMNQLLQKEGGSIFSALEDYLGTKGPQGQQYASQILNRAGVSTSAKAGGTDPGNVTTTPDPQTAGLIPNPLNIPGDIQNAVTGALGGVIQGILKAFGVPDFKDLFQRLALILLGVALVLVGIKVLSQGGSGRSQFQVNTSSATDESGTTTSTREVKHPFGKAGTKTVSGTGATGALEAAAVA